MNIDATMNLTFHFSLSEDEMLLIIKALEYSCAVIPFSMDDNEEAEATKLAYNKKVKLMQSLKEVYVRKEDALELLLKGDLN